MSYFEIQQIASHKGIFIICNVLKLRNHSGLWTLLTTSFFLPHFNTRSTVIVNCSTTFHSPAMLHHVMDLKPIIEDSRQPCVTLVMDNGPDQSIKSDKNTFALGYLFECCN